MLQFVIKLKAIIKSPKQTRLSLGGRVDLHGSNFKDKKI